MADVIRGTTPSVSYKVRSDLSGLDCYLTFEHARGLVTKTGDDLTVTTGSDDRGEYTLITAKLTQRETLGFPEGGHVKVQVRAVNQDGSTAFATYVAKFKADEVLLERVLPL